jgi:tRNA 2-selenouridine synthase
MGGAASAAGLAQVTELPFHRERAESAVSTPLTLAALEAFDDLLDARSPAEFAEDHLPGAASAPVLDDAQRAMVGTIYKQQSAFEAKRAGAPLVARNIARLMAERFATKPREWRPLVYCWRGGGRSGALVHVLRQVGWDAVRLEGGYKAFRRQVVADLDSLPQGLRFRVVCGPTGSGKSRLLEALGRTGAQVLDLEALAAHRGSVLGELPGAPQPSQKAFETSLWALLSRFDASRTVYVESESRKVGNLRVPDVLLARMREAECLRLEAAEGRRVRLLMEEYDHFVHQPGALAAKLDCLKSLHGAERIERWKALLERGAWDDLVAGLLEGHYDPAYLRSLPRNYKGARDAPALEVRDISAAGFDELALRVRRDHG